MEDEINFDIVYYNIWNNDEQCNYEYEVYIGDPTSDEKEMDFAFFVCKRFREQLLNNMYD